MIEILWHHNGNVLNWSFVTPEFKVAKRKTYLLFFSFTHLIYIYKYIAYIDELIRIILLPKCLWLRSRLPKWEFQQGDYDCYIHLSRSSHLGCQWDCFACKKHCSGQYQILGQRYDSISKWLSITCANSIQKCVRGNFCLHIKNSLYLQVLYRQLYNLSETESQTIKL